MIMLLLGLFGLALLLLFILVFIDCNDDITPVKRSNSSIRKKDSRIDIAQEYEYKLILNLQEGRCTKMFIEHKDKIAYIFNTSMDVKTERIYFDYRNGVYKGHGTLISKSSNNGLFDYEIDIQSYNCTQ